MQRFRDLKVWQRSHALVKKVYSHTRRFPEDERFGIVPQLRRAAVSVPTNVAEGSKRSHKADYARFLNIAEASLSETQYLLLLSSDLDYLPSAAFSLLDTEIEEIARMLFRLRRKVEAG
jgi:four helix bundle protein